eukprot:scaffold46233_cov719-Isochrysis_galbana.AAC.1
MRADMRVELGHTGEHLARVEAAIGSARRGGGDVAGLLAARGQHPLVVVTAGWLVQLGLRCPVVRRNLRRSPTQAGDAELREHNARKGVTLSLPPSRVPRNAQARLASW